MRAARGLACAKASGLPEVPGVAPRPLAMPPAGCCGHCRRGRCWGGAGGGCCGWVVHAAAVLLRRVLLRRVEGPWPPARRLHGGGRRRGRRRGVAGASAAWRPRASWRRPAVARAAVPASGGGVITSRASHAQAPTTRRASRVRLQHDRVAAAAAPPPRSRRTSCRRGRSPQQPAAFQVAQQRALDEAPASLDGLVAQTPSRRNSAAATAPAAPLERPSLQSRPLREPAVSPPPPRRRTACAAADHDLRGASGAAPPSAPCSRLARVALDDRRLRSSRRATCPPTRVALPRRARLRRRPQICMAAPWPVPHRLFDATRSRRRRGTPGSSGPISWQVHLLAPPQLGCHAPAAAS